MPMPSKGDRHTVSARFPIPEAEKLEAVVKATNDNRGDFVVRIVSAYLATIDLDQVRNQGVLPLAEAS